MFLISWNVAGWSSTSAAIRDSYGSVQHFLDLTGADVVCLQECKGTWPKLEADPIVMGASDPPPAKRKRVPAVAPLRVSNAGAPPSERSPSAAFSPPASPAGSGGIEGWESFWALSSPVHRGFNGVVTFARKGLVWRCDNAPFAEAEFNEEGRVVVTHLSAFVLVNVYVPNARGGERVTFKFRFLEALKGVMEKLRRETHKPVVLVGDLNMTYRPEDASWMLQRLHLGELIELNKNAEACAAEDDRWLSTHPNLPRSTLQRLTNASANILCGQLCELHAAHEKSTRSCTDAAAPTAALARVPSTTVVSVDSAGQGKEEETFDFVKVRAMAERVHSLSPNVGAGGLVFSDPPVSLAELYACGFRSVFVDELLSTNLPTHNKEVFALAQYCGLPPHAHKSVLFMSSLLHETHWRCEVDSTRAGAAAFAVTREKMWDTFCLSENVVRAVSEGASASSLAEVDRRNTGYCPCPFTCWDQSKNKRLTNDGTRLDYILVDSALVPYVVPRASTANNTGFILSLAERGAEGRAPCRPEAPVAVTQPIACACEGSDDNPQIKDNAFFAKFSGAHRTDSIRRAMADGLYPSAPYDRSGLPPLQDVARGCAFCGLPATGLFVSPPQLSDHIGVCLQLRTDAVNGTRLTLVHRSGKLVEDNGKCVYRPPVGLHAFFAKALTAPLSAAAAQAQKPALSSQRAQDASTRDCGDEDGRLRAVPSRKTEAVDVDEED